LPTLHKISNLSAHLHP